MIENILTGLLVACALIFMGKRLFRVFQRISDASSKDGCGGCGCKTKNPSGPAKK